MENVVEVRNLKKSFDGVVAVGGIDIEVEKGTIYALLGPNGAGKSTTIRILEGLLRKDSGDVSVLDLDPWKELEKLKWKIGVMPQEFNFFEYLSPREGITLYSRLFESKSYTDDLLKMVLMEHSDNTMFKNLSGGQKQKLGLALSLVNDPDLLFLDEPTTGLDPSSRRAIWSVIRSFKERGKTIILTTHYMEEAEQLADRVSIINKGKIVATGTPEEIVENLGGGRKLVLKAGKQMFDLFLSKGIPASMNGNSIEVSIDGAISVLDIVTIIENSGIKYNQLTIRGDSLEDVFVKIVGNMSEGVLN